jgi:hypothetical protein
MADTDILLGGFGLFGGRGEYTGKIKVLSDKILIVDTCLICVVGNCVTVRVTAIVVSAAVHTADCYCKAAVDRD